MTAVADTTPLNYLILIGASEVLPALFQRVVIPQAVLSELNHLRSPEAVRAWASKPPGWLEVETVAVVLDANLAKLDAGEREAILLADQVGADVLLVDERAAYRVASQRGLGTMGTLGVLETASVGGLIDFRAALERLLQTTFHVSDVVLEPFLERDARRAEDSD